jgi:hypothetical protein
MMATATIGKLVLLQHSEMIQQTIRNDLCAGNVLGR